ncbi:MAG: pirin family protein [Methanomassiliicoccales archaeon]|nr:pirin family protein [Methanomassiliicoccales archaeon]
MTVSRKVAKTIAGPPTSNGAGVKLIRMFSRDEAKMMDPFLMLDLFGSDRPKDYMAGFPMHPHRGIETVTYMLEGRVDHRDSLGNEGTIGPGDVQWMTAGSGILHEEMPQLGEGRLKGFQLWVNLPHTSKMIPPKYREIKRNDIPISGVKNIFVVVYDGAVKLGEERKDVASGNLALFGPGDKVRMEVGKKAAKFLVVSGVPLREPIAWSGSIVMNTTEELNQALAELEDGSFIRKNR